MNVSALSDILQNAINAEQQGADDIAVDALLTLLALLLAFLDLILQ